MNETTTEKNRHNASAAEVARNFGRYEEMAQHAPVFITSHHRESLVLLSATEYARLKALDDRIALHPANLPEDMKAALETTQPPEWTKKFNHEYDPK